MRRRSTCAFRWSWCRNRTRAASSPRTSPNSPRAAAELPRVRLRGLMCIPPPQPDVRRASDVFARLRTPARGAERERPQARYTVDGDERGLRIGDRRGRDAWCASARRYSAAGERARRGSNEGSMNNIRRLAFIGGGNMAAALIGGLTRRGLPSERIVGGRPEPGSAATAWSRDYGVKTRRRQRERGRRRRGGGARRQAAADARRGPGRSRRTWPTRSPLRDLRRRRHPACGARALVRTARSR